MNFNRYVFQWHGHRRQQTQSLQIWQLEVQVQTRFEPEPNLKHSGKRGFEVRFGVQVRQIRALEPNQNRTSE